MKIVYVERDRCIACLSCQQACQIHQASKGNGDHASIFVNVDMDRRLIFTGTCLHCETARCMEVCPIDALTRDAATGAVVVDKDLCFGCGMCVDACPHGNMRLDDASFKAVKCDLCNGNPICVQVCMAEALHFGNIEQLAQKKRQHPDLRLGLRALPKTEDPGL